MIETLPEGEPRYVTFDLDCESSDGRKISKIVLLTWYFLFNSKVSK